MKKTSIAVLTAALLSTGAYAQTMSTSASNMAANSTAAQTRTALEARQDAKLQAHINDLHAKLQITPSEEAQWATVADAMRASANAVDTAIDKREAGLGSATAVDDLVSYEAVAQAHADSVKRLVDAFSPLYASMSDQQKKIADDVFAQRAHTKSPSAAAK